MSPDVIIRDAQGEDLKDICAIFNEVISSGNVIYQDTLYKPSDLVAWLKNKQQNNYPVIVAELSGQVIGFGACDAFRARECYKTTAELAVHLYSRSRGKGIGTQIIQRLMELSRSRGVHSLIACIDSQNTGSIRLHKKLEFTTVGTMKEVARKGGQWLNLVIMEKHL
jgi:L-amino acid N-acyltransferase